MQSIAAHMRGILVTPAVAERGPHFGCFERSSTVDDIEDDNRADDLTVY